MVQEFVLKLKPEELDLVFSGLGELPFKTVADVYVNIRNQAMEQANPQMPVDEPEDKE